MTDGAGDPDADFASAPPDRDEYPDPDRDDFAKAVRRALTDDTPWSHHQVGRYTAHKTFTEHEPDAKPGDKTKVIRVTECDRDVIADIPVDKAGELLAITLPSDDTGPSDLLDITELPDAEGRFYLVGIDGDYSERMAQTLADRLDHAFDDADYLAIGGHLGADADILLGVIDDKGDIDELDIGQVHKDDLRELVEDV